MDVENTWISLTGVKLSSILIANMDNINSQFVYLVGRGLMKWVGLDGKSVRFFQPATSFTLLEYMINNRNNH